MKQEIRKILGTDKLIIGTDRTVKALRAAALKKVVIASNCPDSTVEEITNLTTLNKVELVKATETNEELGVVCKKPFRVSVLGFV